MGNLLKYVGTLGAISFATDEEAQRELLKALSLDKMTKGITSGMSEINQTIDDIRGSRKISFHLGNNQLSLNDLYVYFSDKVSVLWNSGNMFQAIMAIIVLVLGVIGLFVLPLISTIRYIVAGIKEKTKFKSGLRSFLMRIGIEASAGILLVFFFVRVISL